MSTPSSPPVSAAYVPYQAYKSKRHSRNLSNSSPHLTPNQSTPPLSKLSNGTDTLFQPPRLSLEADSDVSAESVAYHEHTSLQHSEITTGSEQPWTLSKSSHSPPSACSTEESMLQPSIVAETLLVPLTQGKSVINLSQSNQAQQISAAHPQGPSGSQLTPKKASTYRRLQPRNSRSGQPPVHSSDVFGPTSPLAIGSTIPQDDAERLSASRVTPPVSSVQSPLVVPKIEISASRSSQQPSQVPSVGSSVSRALPTSGTIDGESTMPARSPHNISSSLRKAAPYRPGFQPKGVYRPLTDEFLSARRSIRDGEGEGGMKRVERTKLERRLEKLISLHFPNHTSSEMSKEGPTQQARVETGMLGRDKRRASSFFDFQSLRNLNISDAGDLWRGVVTGGLGNTTKTDIRAAEQRITPWQDDAIVTKCPLCLTIFHPLTNRKHHCRLCGQIICSLPVKHPQRKVLCSVLFVVDAPTREIEEVGEGVDYGVKRRRTDSITGLQGRLEEEDKFLKGVRVCRECRPILLKQQYYRQTRFVPPFVNLYENFISLEVDIEDSLPLFQELLLSLNHHDQPTKEASAARKRLLNSFAQYDKLSKRIRALPCPNGPGSSQDRVQAAILTRANLFLQKNMFPLQSLPTPQPSSNVPAASKSSNSVNIAALSNISIDIDSALAHSLQPLLEQESLLESFVAEAQMQRKFEDVKTLKSNLAEIRQEIERIVEGKGH
ncbi:hypothetical protein GALMADRAFT_239465 [Galerina marginata CBS 339.88]|uniref:FYVE-type domain-containing protein n=1 Tax=Galerina marginata (strain CBS 339.88) TaxID=685588 RepID=A0A067TEE3_GALM3|nr:hypothetical protein GALMADRAFT_239465 [Galerina marginata CBS 339.88]